MHNRFVKIGVSLMLLAIVGWFGGIPYLDNNSISQDVDSLKNFTRVLNVSGILKSDNFYYLPKPVKKYLSDKIKDKTFSPKLSTITLEGKTRNSQNSDWIEASSTLYFSTIESSFIQIIENDLGNYIWNKEIKKYFGGKASTTEKLLSSIPIDEFSGNKLNKSFLVLYLMESVFSPTVLLPREKIRWKPINNFSARVTIWNENLDGSAIFYFNSKNQITKIVSSERYKPGKVDYSKETFTIHFANYKDVGNYIIPTYFEFQWNLPGNNFTFARFQIKDITYQ